MEDSENFEYLYGRICGLFSSMYLGKRGAEIAKSERIQDIWAQLFSEQPPLIPALQLLDLCERKVVEMGRLRVFNLSKQISETDELAQALLKKSEYSEIKRVLHLLKNNEPAPGNLFILPKQKAFALDQWPDAGAIFAKTQYSWIKGESLSDIGALENRLDKLYYTDLWAAAINIPDEEDGAIKMLIGKEVAYQNLMWAIRVRRYYGYGKDKAMPLLVQIPEIDSVSLAESIFEINIDDPSSLRAWKYAAFLDNQPPNAPLDVSLLENRLQKELFIRVRRSLHIFPFTYTPLYCYFKFSEAEVALLLGILEGIRFNASLEEKVAHAWALSGETA